MIVLIFYILFVPQSCVINVALLYQDPIIDYTYFFNSLVYIFTQQVIILFPGTILEIQVEQEADFKKWLDFAQTLTQSLLKRWVFVTLFFRKFDSILLLLAKG